MSRSRQRWLVASGVCLLLIATAVHFFEWNMLRGLAARSVERATGRSFRIDGDLQVRLARAPRITVEHLVLGNAPGSADADMAKVGRLEFTVDPWALWRGRVVLPEVSVQDARLLLEKNARGVGNWHFRDDGKASPPPSIGALAIDRSHVDYRDPAARTSFGADISTLGSDHKDAGMVVFNGRGSVKGEKATIEGRVGSLLALSSPGVRYPLDVRAVIGATRARVRGELVDPLHLKSEDLNFELQGPDMAQLFPLLGVPLPPTPPYRLSGRLAHSGELWTFSGFAGRVGNSDLAGDFQVDRARKPQLITAKLTSRNLDMKDLGGFIGGTRGDAKPSAQPAAPGRILPREPFSLDKLRIADADVTFRGEHVITEKLPLDAMTVTLKVHDGVLTLEPLNFGVAGGHVVSQVRMDARQAVIRTHADIAVNGLKLEQLFPGFRLSRANAGVIRGRAKLDTAGNSVAQMLAGADGDAALMMEGGSVSELLVRLVNLDVANAIPVLITGDKQLPVRCMVVHLAGTKGHFNAKTLVLDTGKAVVTGSGAVDFAREALDLKLVSRSKGISLAALRGPIRVTGTFEHPKVAPDVTQAVARGVAAVALGWFTGGLGALIPLVDLGGAKDSDCAALIRNAGPQDGRKLQRTATP